MLPPFLNIPQTLCETRGLIFINLSIYLSFSLSVIYNSNLYTTNNFIKTVNPLSPLLFLRLSLSLSFSAFTFIFIHNYSSMKCPCTHSFLYMTLNFINNTTSLNFAIFSSNKLKDSTLVNVSEHFILKNYCSLT